MIDLTPDPASLEDIETASQQHLQELQLARMRSTLTHAYANVSHYRQAFDDAGVTPEDCHSLQDLSQ
ncbi:MAG: hypothetical protein ACR2HR_09295 [Euzebya sp.]